MEIVVGLFHENDKKKGIPKTLVLDLDETLVHSWENPTFLEGLKIYSDPTTYRRFHPMGEQQIAYSMLLDVAPGKQSRIWGLYRPHVYEFLAFCSEYFENVIVWSAGLRDYVNEISKIFSEAGLRFPKMIWSREHCSNYQGLYHKPINNIITDLANRPFSSFHIDPRWTLIVDDKIHTFKENPQSGVLIPPYHPGKDNPGKIPSMNDLLDRSDNALLKLKAWLERPEVRDASDIRNVDKSNIFK